MAGAGYFVSRCKAPARARRKIAGSRHCLAGSLAAGSPSQKAGDRSSPTHQETPAIRREGIRSTAFVSRTGGESELHEARYVLRDELHSQRCPKRIDAETSEILVEIAAAR